MKLKMKFENSEWFGCAADRDDWWLPIYNPDQIPNVLDIELADLRNPGSRFSWPGKWRYALSDGWTPTYSNPDNSGCDEPAEPIAYVLKA